MNLNFSHFTFVDKSQWYKKSTKIEKKSMKLKAGFLLSSIKLKKSRQNYFFKKRKPWIINIKNEIRGISIDSKNIKMIWKNVYWYISQLIRNGQVP